MGAACSCLSRRWHLLAHAGLQVKADRHIDEDHSIEELQEHSENLAHEDHHGVPHPRTGCASPIRRRLLKLLGDAG